MLFNRIRRAGTWAGLAGALALAMPAGTASARTHGQPTALTVTPQLEARLAEAASPRAAERTIEVADRRRYYRPRHYRGHPYRGRPHRRYYRRHRGVDPGAAVAAGIIGLAAGAIAAQALAGSNRTVVVQDPYAHRRVYRRVVPAPYTAEWYRQCDIKYRSFRARDGTYLGYDGVRHVCRLP